MKEGLVSKECIEIRAKIAKESGLTLLGNPTVEHKGNAKYQLYRFDTCGHEQNIDSSLVKAKKYKCRQCEEDYLNKEAEEKGLELLERACLGVQPLYKFKSCGHTQRIGYTSVRRGTYKCQGCYYKGETLVEKYTREALLKGLKFIKVSDVKSVGIYECPEGHTFEYQISATRTKHGVNCSVCKKNKLVEDAAKYGLTVKSFDVLKTKVDYRTYTFNSCGHDIEMSSSGMLNQETVTCKVCKDTNEKQQAANRGATLVKREKHQGIYVLSCGHTKKIVPSLMKSGGFRCIECYEDNLKKIGLEYGYKYIGKSIKGGHYRLFERVTCGHRRDLQVHDLTGYKRKEMWCPECIAESHKTEAESAGLILVGLSKTEDPNRREYIAKCCNNLIDLTVVQVRSNSWTCTACGENHYSDPSSVYLLKINQHGKDWLKLGMAKDVHERMKGYGLHTDAIIDVLEVKNMETGYLAIAFEKSLHRKHKEYRLDPDEMREYHQSGFTECYPLNMFETLTKELNGN